MPFLEQRSATLVWKIKAFCKQKSINEKNLKSYITFTIFLTPNLFLAIFMVIISYSWNKHEWIPERKNTIALKSTNSVRSSSARLRDSKTNSTTASSLFFPSSKCSITSFLQRQQHYHLRLRKLKTIIWCSEKQRESAEVYCLNNRSQYIIMKRITSCRH